MRMIAVLSIAVFVLAAPTGAAAYDRLVNPFQSCALSGAPEYATLQAAADAASPGDQIGVCPGTYDESVVVNTPVTFTGIGLAVIDRSPQQQACFLIQAAGVTVRYLVIRGCPIGISVAGDNALIQNNQLRSNIVGIQLTFLAGTSIVQNNLVEDNQQGIDFGIVGTGIVKNNTLRRNLVGIGMLSPQGALVTKNSIQDGNTGIVVGEAPKNGPTHDTTISFNTVSFNSTGIVWGQAGPAAS